jgi:hypothetical protein
MAFEEIPQIIGQEIMQFFYSFVPNFIIPNLQLIVQIIILLILGFIVGKLSKSLVTRILSIIGLKRVTAKSWFGSLLKVTGYRGTVVELIGDLVKWLIYILFLAFIIQTLGIQGVAELFNQIAGFIPRFIGAIVIAILGFLIADFFGKVFEEAARKLVEEEMLANLSGGLAKCTISVIVIVMALAMIGIDTISLIVMFAIILSAIMVIVILGLRDSFPSFTAYLHLRKELKVGEFIRIGKESGVVEKVSPLSVTLLNGTKRSQVPNYLFMRESFERKQK